MEEGNTGGSEFCEPEQPIDTLSTGATTPCTSSNSPTADSAPAPVTMSSSCTATPPPLEMVLSTAPLPHTPTYFLVPSATGGPLSVSYGVVAQDTPDGQSAPPPSPKPFDPVLCQFGVGGVAALPSSSFGVYPTPQPAIGAAPDGSGMGADLYQDGRSRRYKMPRLCHNTEQIGTKVERRLMQNREAAKRCRMRKQQYVKNLEEEVQNLRKILGVGEAAGAPSMADAKNGAASTNTGQNATYIKQRELVGSIRECVGKPGMEETLRNATSGLLGIEAAAISHRQQVCSEGKWYTVASAPYSSSGRHLALWMGGWKPSVILRGCSNKVERLKIECTPQEQSVLDTLAAQCEEKECEVDQMYENGKVCLMSNLVECCVEMPLGGMSDCSPTCEEVTVASSGGASLEDGADQTAEPSVADPAGSSPENLWIGAVSDTSDPLKVSEPAGVGTSTPPAAEAFKGDEGKSSETTDPWQAALEPRKDGLMRLVHGISDGFARADHLRAEVLSQAQQFLSIQPLSVLVTMPVGMEDSMDRLSAVGNEAFDAGIASSNAARAGGVNVDQQANPDS
ncbi:hypothetical protein BSKO_01808 [Bryopsis sp. KO-2023]|nr:hypothetical protein BSKO_01808 [Bryopsis sp. KO-2023]